MHILNICDAKGWDMVAYQALHTANHLNRTGNQAVVLCHKESRLYEECKKLRVKTQTITLGLKLGFFETGGWEIVHFYNPDYINPLFLRRARSSSKIFVTQVKLGSQRAFDKLALLDPSIDRFIAGCNSVQEEFYRVGINQRKTFTVPPAINMGRWESAMLIKPAMFLRRPYRIGTVSMDPTFREQELFLLMAKEVLNVLPDTNFLIVGLKDERVRDAARKLGISHKVDMLWERTDMPEVMAMMHIYAKTAVREGMSMSLIEAQASGVACIVPRLRGMSDFIVCDRNAVVVEPGDVSAYTNAVIHLVNNPPVCHAMSKIAFDCVANNMSLPVVSNLLLRLYEESLA